MRESRECVAQQLSITSPSKKRGDECCCAPALALQRRALLFEWLDARVRRPRTAKALVEWTLFVDLIEVASPCPSITNFEHHPLHIP
jgi:hypothetical protein